MHKVITYKFMVFHLTIGWQVLTESGVRANSTSNEIGAVHIGSARAVFRPIRTRELGYFGFQSEVGDRRIFANNDGR